MNTECLTCWVWGCEDSGSDAIQPQLCVDTAHTGFRPSTSSLSPGSLHLSLFQSIKLVTTWIKEGQNTNTSGCWMEGVFLLDILRTGMPGRIQYTLNDWYQFAVVFGQRVSMWLLKLLHHVLHWSSVSAQQQPEHSLHVVRVLQANNQAEWHYSSWTVEHNTFPTSLSSPTSLYVTFVFSHHTVWPGGKQEKEQLCSNSFTYFVIQSDDGLHTFTRIELELHPSYLLPASSYFSTGDYLPCSVTEKGKITSFKFHNVVYTISDLYWHKTFVGENTISSTCVSAADQLQSVVRRHMSEFLCRPQTFKL